MKIIYVIDHSYEDLVVKIQDLFNTLEDSYDLFQVNYFNLDSTTEENGALLIFKKRVFL